MKEKWCFTCYHCVRFKKHLWFCMMARNFIPNTFLAADCDYYHKDERGGYIDHLHDNDAMDRQIEADDHIIPTTE